MFIKVFNNCRFVCMVTFSKDSKVFDPVPQSSTQAYSSLPNTHKPPCIRPNRDTLWIWLINHFPWHRKQNSLSLCLPNRLFPMLRRSSPPKCQTCQYWARWMKSTDKHLLLPGFNSSWSLAREMQHFSVKARPRPGRVSLSKLDPGINPIKRLDSLTKLKECLTEKRIREDKTAPPFAFF